MLLIATTPSFSQIYTASDLYPNGQLKFKGRFVVCSTRDKKFPSVEIFEKRKFGKWVAYNPNGTVKETRQYTKKGKDCSTKILRKGEWKYFNQNGIPYLTELYVNDTLIFSELDIYENDSLIGKFIRPDQAFDPLDFNSLQTTKNHIPNPSFEKYFYKPILIENNGQDQIENLVPFWSSPDMATPDYYNNYRTVHGVPNHMKSMEESTDPNGYLGLMLYLDPNTNRLDQSTNYSYTNKEKLDYKESIQAKLKMVLSENESYCFKARILLSGNAGYSINRFGVLLTDKPIHYDYFDSPVNPTLSFTLEVDDSKNWIALCKGFVANGDESYITVGRFSPLESTQITKHIPNRQSSLDINKSAYYLLDDLQLYEVNNVSECGCLKSEPLSSKPQEPIDFKEFDPRMELNGNRYILNNILFDFNKAEIKNSFIPELQKLLYYLENNTTVSIKIKGYTDDSGDDDYNKQLSNNRARAISLWLIDHGIEEERIQSEGFGSSNPLVENLTDSNRELNRRVEIEFLDPDI